jgi:hypothetical protein
MCVSIKKMATIDVSSLDGCSESDKFFFMHKIGDNLRIKDAIHFLSNKIKCSPLEILNKCDILYNEEIIVDQRSFLEQKIGNISGKKQNVNGEYVEMVEIVLLTKDQSGELQRMISGDSWSDSPTHEDTKNDLTTIWNISKYSVLYFIIGMCSFLFIALLFGNINFEFVVNILPIITIMPLVILFIVAMLTESVNLVE